MINRTALYCLMFSCSVVASLHCKTVQQSISPKDEPWLIYINQFKLTYLRQLLIKSYNYSAAVQEIIRLDHSGFTEPVLTKADYELIDSITTVHNARLQLDSINRIGKVSEGAEGKRSLGFIVQKLNGKWLDSLAGKRYKLSARQ